jgi:hypothetical protein
MADEPAPPEDKQEEANALETPDSPTSEDEGGSLENATATDDGTIDATNPGTAANNANRSEAPPRPKGFKAFIKRFNIYLLLFIFILLIGSVILVIAYFQSKQAATTSTITTQDLTQEALRQLANGDANVGGSGQVLTVQSSAVFAGRVLIRDGLEVATNLQVGGTAALANLTVSGTSQFAQAQVDKNLSVAGDASVQGSLTAKSLQISGGGTFSGPVSAPQITTSSFQLNSDLVLTRHITAGGPTPSLSRGAALGGSGTVGISGSDTAGAVNINIGGSTGAGCYVTVNFALKFNSTPHVVLTPVGADGASLDYYVTRNTAGFSICNASTTPAGASFSFDYFVVN